MLCLVLVCLFSSLVQAEIGGLLGSGTAIDPYLIENREDLMRFSNSSYAHKYWQAGVYVRLKADIELNTSSTTALAAPDSKEDLPYSYNGAGFAGIFDGCGHTISNLNIVTEDHLTEYLGLFGKVTGTVRNLKLTNLMIITRNSINYAGGICGMNEGGEISNCSISGIIITKSNCYYLGGICGGNYGGKITECQSDCLIRSGSYCWYLGGISGYNEQGYISRSFAEYRISSDNCGMGLGGICGANTKSGVVSNSYANGKIYCMKRNTFVGGLCGLNSHGGYILNSYSVGEIQADYAVEHSGGLCGSNTGRIKNSFWDTDSGGTTGSGGTGLANAEMRQPATFANAGWSVYSNKGNEAIWQVNEGEYPVLIWGVKNPTADINGDGKVDILDFGCFSVRWLEEQCQDKNWCDGTDIDMSGEVDRRDLECILEKWLE